MFPMQNLIFKKYAVPKNETILFLFCRPTDPIFFAVSTVVFVLKKITLFFFRAACHPYVTRMSFACHVIHMSLVCTRMSSVCH